MFADPPAGPCRALAGGLPLTAPKAGGKPAGSRVQARRAALAEALQAARTLGNGYLREQLDRAKQEVGAMQAQVSQFSDALVRTCAVILPPPPCYRPFCVSYVGAPPCLFVLKYVKRCAGRQCATHTCRAAARSLARSGDRRCAPAKTVLATAL